MVEEYGPGWEPPHDGVPWLARCGLCSSRETPDTVKRDPRRWRLSRRHGLVHTGCLQALRRKEGTRRARHTVRGPGGRFVTAAELEELQERPLEALEAVTGPLGLSGGRKGPGDLPLFVAHPTHGTGRVVGPPRKGRPTRVPVRLGDFPRPEVTVMGIGFGYVHAPDELPPEWTVRHLPLKELRPA